MSDTSHKINTRIVLGCIGFCIFAGLLTVGTFNDKSISDTLYSPENVFCRSFGVIGPMPLFFVLALFFGALVQRSFAMKNAARIPVGVFLILMTLGVSFFGARTFTSSDCLDTVIPSVRGSIPLMIPITLLVFVPVAFAGYRLAAKNDDEKLVRRILMLLIAVTAAYAAQEIIKDTMHRPRYRTAIKGFEGVGFLPWYERFTGYTKELPDTLGVLKTEFSSFPSGHSMMSMTSFITFPALAWLIPALRGKEVLLSVCGAVYSVTVMFTRVVMGAHYLSDTAFSGAVMLLVSVIYMILLKKTYKEDK